MTTETSRSAPGTRFFLADSPSEAILRRAVTYRTPYIALIFGLSFAAACIGEPTSDEVEQELDDLVEGSPLTITFRDCTCDENLATATSYSARFEDWPDYRDCLTANKDAAHQVSERMSQNRAFVLEYLDPRPDGRPIRHYWHHDTRWGTFYRYVSCNEVPADEPCGWRSRDFDEFSLSSRAHQFQECDGDGTIDSATVTTAVDGQPARTLPASLLAEADADAD